MAPSAYLIPLLLLAIGVCYLASDSDLLWSYHRLQLRMQGITSVERTPEWDFARKFTGYGCIACALITLFLIMAASPSQNSAMRSGNLEPGAESNFTLNGTPMSPREVEEARAMGLFSKDKGR